MGVNLDPKNFEGILEEVAFTSEKYGRMKTYGSPGHELDEALIDLLRAKEQAFDEGIDPEKVEAISEQFYDQGAANAEPGPRKKYEGRLQTPDGKKL